MEAPNLATLRIEPGPADVRPPPTDWSKVPLTPAPTPAPPSTASYEEAIREPEPTGPRDDRPAIKDFT